MKKIWIKGVSVILTFAMLVTALPVQAMAAEVIEIPLPEVELEEEILSGDMFYLASTAAGIEEGGRGV